MAKKYFPAQNRTYRYLQLNRGDELGNIWASFGLDFQENLGAIRLARKMVVNADSTDSANLGMPTAFEFFDGKWIAICGTRVYRGADEQATSPITTEDTNTGALTDYSPFCSDLKAFNNKLWTTSVDKLMSKDSNGSATGSWTKRDDIGDSSTSGYSHQMTYLKNFNRLYYIDTATAISSIDSLNNIANVDGNYFLDVGSGVGALHCMDASDSEIWIGTTRALNNFNQTSQGTGCSILLWDGISSQPSREFKIDAQSIMAIKVIGGIPHVVDSNGRILKFSGTDFVEIARFPFKKNLPRGAATSNYTRGKFIHFNGMAVTENNTVLFNISGVLDNLTYQENIPSGIWELDLSTGNLTHKHSFHLKKITGDLTDYGQNSVYSVGAIKSIWGTMTTTITGRVSIMAGAEVYTNATQTKKAVFIDYPYGTANQEYQKRGYFVTTFMQADDIADKWAKVWTTYKRLLNDTDKIVFKYRLEEEAPIYVNITWTSGNTFTTTTDLTSYVGAEVEVLQGGNSGACPHITNVSGSGTFTVAIDETLASTSGTATARVQHWKKILPEITGRINSYEKMPIAETNTQIQIKCCMSFTGDNEFHKFVLSSVDEVKATA